MISVFLSLKLFFLDDLSINFFSLNLGNLFDIEYSPYPNLDLNNNGNFTTGNVQDLITYRNNCISNRHNGNGTLYRNARTNRTNILNRTNIISNLNNFFQTIDETGNDECPFEENLTLAVAVNKVNTESLELSSKFLI